MIAQKVFLATLGLICLSASALCGAYGGGYGGAAGTVYDAIPDVVDSYANPNINVAAAKAASSKLSGENIYALNRYGYEIGKPLLVRGYGPLTSLYSALAPKRSFVGTIDSGFYKDSYGNLKFRDESSVGAIAV